MKFKWYEIIPPRFGPFPSIYKAKSKSYTLVEEK